MAMMAMTTSSSMSVKAERRVISRSPKVGESSAIATKPTFIMKLRFSLIKKQLTKQTIRRQPQLFDEADAELQQPEKADGRAKLTEFFSEIALPTPCARLMISDVG